MQHCTAIELRSLEEYKVKTWMYFVLHPTLFVFINSICINSEIVFCCIALARTVINSTDEREWELQRKLEGKSNLKLAPVNYESSFT